MKSKEPWYARTWRPAAAFVYFVICLNDFMIMPMYYEYMNHKVQASQYVELALQFNEGAAQIEALKAIRQTRVWEPLTLSSTGLFHMSFLTILGVAAWTRGNEKIERVKKEPIGYTEEPVEDEKAS